jgi:acetoacetyl-CoA reductase
MMVRVAVVTGGTRGIGKAISLALHKAGYKVVANYAGNDEKAKAFEQETQIPARKWDVSNFDDCLAAIANIVAEFGPVEVLVNNAGITRDGTMRKMARVAVVTGGTRGIGKAISLALHKAGYQVLANYAGNDEKAKAFEQEAHIAVRKWDVSNLDACLAAVAKIVAEFGPVDVVVNNAGITRDATMRKMSRAAWDEVLDVDLGGCFNMCKVVWESMLERGFGRIVNIGSVNGQAGQYGQVNYAAAKSGIHGFTKALAQEGATKGITVNAIAPGYIDTDMLSSVPPTVLEKILARIPVGRLGKSEEIARGVTFLVADDAGFITGSTLSINGGQHMY